MGAAHGHFGRTSGAILGLTLMIVAGGVDAAAKPGARKPPKPAPDARLDVYAEPGERIDIGGGRKLNLRCSGQGRPTVLLEAGFGSDSLAWARSQPQIAERNRVCAYDRAGLGFSDGGPLPRDLTADVADLHALIEAADLDTPLILLGHSYGSQVVRRYDELHPKKVAALVLVDPPEQNVGEFSASYAKTEAAMAPRMLAMYRACEQGAREGRLGAARPPAELRNCLRPPNPNYSDKLNAAIRAWRSKPTFWETVITGSQDRLSLYGSAVAKSERHDGKPVIVLSAEQPYAGAPADDLKALTAAREQTHMALIGTSRYAKRVTIADSSHDIPNDQPAAPAIAVFEAMQMRKQMGR
ncbi:alpha/beta fold hydrolase [Lysobacter enzymogenes]|uniref:alpha/beta fold hydrolase n=1 Tax=Lysobacter enzymogenes TaxID=69 RepID=UPI001AF12C10|nr:alpha/beta hydrolase [Lysobacter enzymogenes]QQQ02245.1 alpha/beta hydrolase [Lysobacter enzymogenes]